ncbi:hypothetical protein EG329_003619 [Mollisiaceae sp. DMI_Dod_QoI]|nr:hypothetical protein EG329_003619 [Helotiales sp. DMI_Dod_QoI]
MLRDPMERKTHAKSVLAHARLRALKVQIDEEKQMHHMNWVHLVQSLLKGSAYTHFGCPKAMGGWKNTALAYGPILVDMLDDFCDISSWIQRSIDLRLSSFLESLQIPQTLSDPSPRLFLAACIVFSFAIAWLWQSQKRNKYRARLLGPGIAIGTLASLRSENILQDGKGYLAWSALFALAISAILHRIVPSWREAALAERTDEEVAILWKDEIMGRKLVSYEGMCDEQSNTEIALEKERMVGDAIENESRLDRVESFELET